MKVVVAMWLTMVFEREREVFAYSAHDDYNDNADGTRYVDEHYNLSQIITITMMEMMIIMVVVMGGK